MTQDTAGPEGGTSGPADNTTSDSDSTSDRHGGDGFVPMIRTGREAGIIALVVQPTYRGPDGKMQWIDGGDIRRELWMATGLTEPDLKETTLWFSRGAVRIYVLRYPDIPADRKIERTSIFNRVIEVYGDGDEIPDWRALGVGNGREPGDASWLLLERMTAERDWADNDDETKAGPFVQWGPEVRRRPPLKWLVEDMLPERALFQVFGQTGTYKTFVLIELLGQVANAGDFLGHKVNADGPGLVAMVLGEGGGDIGERVTAWTVAHEAFTDENMAFIIDQDINLLSTADVNRLGENLTRAAAERGLPWRVIAFDTQADHLPSDTERDEATFSRLKPVLLHIARQTGAAVGLVHHTGWDDSRERGSSRQRQMLDVVMEVNHEVITAIKVKAGRLFDPVRFAVRETADSLAVYVPEVEEVLGMEAQRASRDAERIVELLTRVGAITEDRALTLTAVTEELGWGRVRIRTAIAGDARIVVIGGGGRGRPTYLWVTGTEEM